MKFNDYVRKKRWYEKLDKLREKINCGVACANESPGGTVSYGRGLIRGAGEGKWQLDSVVDRVRHWRKLDQLWLTGKAKSVTNVPYRRPGATSEVSLLILSRTFWRHALGRTAEALTSASLAHQVCMRAWLGLLALLQVLALWATSLKNSLMSRRGKSDLANLRKHPSAAKLCSLSHHASARWWRKWPFDSELNRVRLLSAACMGI